MRRTYLVLVPALAAVAGTVALLDLASVRAADAPADPWAQIQELEKAKDEGKCVAKMQEYRDSGGPAAIKNIAGLRKSKSDKIACAAIKMAAAAGDPEHHKALVKMVGDKDLADAKDGRPAVYQTVLDALVLYGEKNKGDGAQDALFDDCIKKYASTNVEYGTRAVRAYGTVPNNATVERLLKLAEGLDAGQGKGGGGGGGSGKGKSTETRDIEGKVRNACIETLNLLTDQDIADAEAFRKWWTEKGGKFVFPKPRDPNAPEAAEKDVGDVTGLKEFIDEPYGYSVKKPEAAEWSFQKADYAGPRVALDYSQPSAEEGGQAYRVARAYYNMHNPKKGPPKDIKLFAEWTKTAIFAKQMDTHERPITIREQNLGGINWTIVEGKGDGIDIKQGWGTMDRRIYLAMSGSQILWIDAFVRLGAEPEIQKEFWKTVEATAITPPKK